MPTQCVQLDQAFETAPFGVLVLDASQTIISANAFVRQCIDSEFSTLPGHKLADVFEVQESPPLPCLHDTGCPCPRAAAQPLGATSVALPPGGMGRSPVPAGTIPIPTPLGQLQLRPLAQKEHELRSLVCFPHASGDGERLHVFLLHATNTTDVFHQGLQQALTHLREAQLEQERLNLEMAKANDHLLQSSKMAGIGQLAAGVAHEINNPVGYVFSNLQTLANYVRDMIKIVDAVDHAANLQELHQLKRALEYDYLRDDVHDLIQESSEGIQRVKQIISALKDFSHIGGEGFKPADLQLGLESTLSLAANEYKYRANVTRMYAEDLPRVECDLSQIKQVMLNLLVNAAQAMPERGEIVVATGHDETSAWFEIADNGSGMPADVVARVFEPFFTTKPVGQGTGLGLALSYSIVRKHGGHIDIHSTPGQGTRVRVWLPLRQVVPNRENAHHVV